MVESICKHFLQLFLAGVRSVSLSKLVGNLIIIIVQYDGIALNYAIHKLIPLQEGQTLEEYNKKNATKVNYSAVSSIQ